MNNLYQLSQIRLKMSEYSTCVPTATTQLMVGPDNRTKKTTITNVPLYH